MTNESIGKQITVRLEGLSDIMFDRFYGQEKDTRPPEQKLYLAPDNKVVMPSENIWAFLFGETPAGCARSEGKTGKEYIRVGQSHIVIAPDLVPFTRNGEEVVFTDFDDGVFYISEFAPRVKSGSLSIKQNVRKRPVLTRPWELGFQLTLIKNRQIDEQKLYNWFVAGGISIGLGTYRPRFGRFMVAQFEAE